MDRTYRFRNGIVIFLILLVVGIYGVRLFTLQLGDSEDNDYGDASTTTYTQYVSSARGDILDRHGTVLVSNRASYNVTLQSFVLFNSDDPNGYLLSLAETCIKYGIEYEDSLPLSMTTPYVYTLDDLSSTDQYTYKKFLLGREWDADMTAENLAKQLKKSYHISDDYTEEEARLIMGLRYELDLPTYASAETYTLAEDVSAENLAILKELSVPGMEVEATTVREYNTTFAAQLLGHVGLMTSEEYSDTYEALDYSMDASVGKDGLEAAFEQYLHGTDGKKVVTVTSDGTVVDEYWEVEPQSGSNVITTIDIGMQEVAEQALAERIQSMAEGKSEGTGGYDADSGAVVAMDVNTGEVLCAANYPTYDPSEYSENYQALAEDESQPLANRALQYAFAPGSTFKMITSLAAMRYGISPSYSVNDTGVYTVYDDYQPVCWIYTSSSIGHGTLDMRGALANSCNVYFYTMGDLMGSSNAIDCIDNVAQAFGFGQSTGSEVTETTGQLASKDLKAKIYAGTQDEDWHAADTLMAAIGQSITTATPLQLCRYVATLANGGTLYNATFLRRAVSSDFQSLVASNDYTAIATDLLSESEYSVIQEGMRMCATEGTAASYFTDYDITVCCKTGTAQHGNGGSDNAAFVCWAPAEDPEIAIAVYVQHGDTGGYYSEVAKAIMDYYFGTKDQAQEIPVENTILAD
jgi:penicillin-binding protein 2